jgi:hypothetical protein
VRWRTWREIRAARLGAPNLTFQRDGDLWIAVDASTGIFGVGDHIAAAIADFHVATREHGEVLGPSRDDSAFRDRLRQRHERERELYERLGDAPDDST